MTPPSEIDSVGTAQRIATTPASSLPRRAPSKPHPRALELSSQPTAVAAPRRRTSTWIEEEARLLEERHLHRSGARPLASVATPGPEEPATHGRRHGRQHDDDEILLSASRRHGEAAGRVHRATSSLTVATLANLEEEIQALKRQCARQSDQIMELRRREATASRATSRSRSSDRSDRWSQSADSAACERRHHNGGGCRCCCCCCCCHALTAVLIRGAVIGPCGPRPCCVGSCGCHQQTAERSVPPKSSCASRDVPSDTRGAFHADPAAGGFVAHPGATDEARAGSSDRRHPLARPSWCPPDADSVGSADHQQRQDSAFHAVPGADPTAAACVGPPAAMCPSGIFMEEFMRRRHAFQ